LLINFPSCLSFFFNSEIETQRNYLESCKDGEIGERSKRAERPEREEKPERESEKESNDDRERG
jgi:hypothetical protein